MKYIRNLLGRIRKDARPPSDDHWLHNRPAINWPYDLLALFMLALFVRGVVLWTAISQLGIDSFLTSTPDTTNYLAAARALIEHSNAAENILFTFGPGFPYLLSIYLRVFGESPLPFLIIQIVLSSLSCLLIYRLSRQLLGDYLISILAGVIAAFSLTSISLSCLILSDTAYFFLFLLSLVLFINGIKSGGWWRFVISGLLLGAAILTRSIGQFWPLALVVIAVILSRENKMVFKVHSVLKSRRVRQIIICLVISLCPMIGWILRNGSVNGVYALAKTSAGGPANVAAMTLERQTGRPYREIESGWYQQALQVANKQQLSAAEEFSLLRSKTTEVFSSSPLSMVRVYAHQTWENLTERDYLHLDLLPKLSQATLARIGIFNRGHAFVWLSLAGLAALIWKRRFTPALILGLLFLYYASMIGFTKWQGSRLFYPGLIPGAVLCAMALVTVTRSIQSVARWVNVRLQIGTKIGAFFDESPDSSKRYLVLTTVALSVAFVVLFRHFIFSDKMLLSVDVFGLGLAHHRLIFEHFLHTHSLPGWNPYPMGGVPFVEAISGAVFYPLSIIDYLGYIPRMIGFNFILHFLLSGVFMYLAARQLKLSPPASLIAGVAYGFSPLMISWVAPGHDGKIYCATFFPLLVLFVDRLLNDGRIRDALLAGAVLGIMIVTPHLQMVMYALAFVAVFTVYRLTERVFVTRSPEGVFRRALLLAAAVAVGLGLSAVQWLPSLRYIPNESPRSYEQTGVEYAETFSLHPEEVVSLVIPEFCGLDVVDQPRTYWGRNSFKDNSESFGPVVCLLALLGLVLPGNRQKYWWLSVCAMVVLYAVGTHTPIFGLLVSYLPLLKQLRAPSTAMFISFFAVAVMVGIGVDSLKSTLENNPRWKKRLFVLLISVAALLFIGSILMMFKGRGFLMYYSHWWYPTVAEESARGSQVQERMMENLPFLQAGVWRAWLLVVGMLMLIWFYLRNNRPFIFVIGLACLMFISTGGFVSRCIGLIDPAVYYEPKPVTNYLREHAGVDRVVGFALNQTSYLIGTYPIQSSIGYHSRATAWYYRLSGEEPARNFMHARFANLVGTKYIVFPNRPGSILNVDTLGPIPLGTVARFGDCLVFENRNAFPRVFLVDSFIVLDSLWPVMVETVNGRTDLRKVALLEQPPELPIRPLGDTTASARIEYYDHDTISVAVTCQTNQLLVLTDAWYSAWHVYVDGKPAEMLRVDGAFRAVPVPAGSRKVEFAYHSKYVTAGAISSVTTLGILTLLGVGALVSKRYFHQKSHPSLDGSS
jgi:hypothetical protein